MSANKPSENRVSQLLSADEIGFIDELVRILNNGELGNSMEYKELVKKFGLNFSKSDLETVYEFIPEYMVGTCHTKIIGQEVVAKVLAEPSVEISQEENERQQRTSRWKLNKEVNKIKQDLIQFFTLRSNPQVNFQLLADNVKELQAQNPTSAAEVDKGLEEIGGMVVKTREVIGAVATKDVARKL